MRRLRRHLFTLFAAASLLLCVAVCGVWVRSHYRYDVKITKRGRTERIYMSMLGRAHYVSMDLGYALPFDDTFGWYSRPLLPTDALPQSFPSRKREFALAGVHVIEGDWREGGWLSAKEPPMPYRAWVVPYWLIALAFATPPGWWLAKRVRRRRRFKAGLCVACGYDLRASPERCPECGTPSK
jgi:hypothetical protein